MDIITKFSHLQSPAVITFGNFDGVHLGHRHIIEKVQDVARTCRLKSALITFYPHPKKFFNQGIKGFQLTNEDQKTAIIEEYGLDFLYLIKFDQSFANLSAESFIKEILVGKCNVKSLIVGSNCSFGQGRSGGINLLRELGQVYGYDVIVVETKAYQGELCSSSRVRELLQRGKVSLANKLLSRNFTIQGKVTMGMQRGRKMNFPTLNIKTGGYIQPKLGVYVVQVYINDMCYQAVAYVGTRPTFEKEKEVVLEVHIFDFEKEIYCESVSVEFIEFVRPEKRFKNMEELKQQIISDAKVAKDHFR